MATSIEKRYSNATKFIRHNKNSKLVKIGEKFVFLMSALLFVMYLSITAQHDVEIQKHGFISPAFSESTLLK